VKKATQQEAGKPVLPKRSERLANHPLANVASSKRAEVVLSGVASSLASHGGRQTSRLYPCVATPRCSFIRAQLSIALATGRICSWLRHCLKMQLCDVQMEMCQMKMQNGEKYIATLLI